MSNILYFLHLYLDSVLNFFLAPVWYEYVRAPCIQMAFPESSNMRTVKEIGGSPYGNKAMCADTRFAVAGTTCCDSNGNPLNICIFKGERTTFNTASNRCTAYGTGYSTCAWNTVSPNWDCGTDVDYNDWSSHTSVGMRFSWTSSTCSMKVQIDPDGYVAMIHSGEFGIRVVVSRLAMVNSFEGATGLIFCFSPVIIDCQLVPTLLRNELRST